MTRWPDKVDGLCYGGDYNPEQWPEETWHEDVRLMREAGVNLVTVGVFAWALLEPVEDRYEFDWLDRVLGLLHEGGIRVDLATATAAPPPWFTRRYPRSQPVTREGQLLWPGSRQLYCPSSPEYRTAAVRLAEALATRFGDHPALALWHVNNEYGCHVAHCFCDVSAAAFRGWLRRRYRSLDALNQAWATSFWSQRYSDWEEIVPPRLSPSFVNPTQQLDFWRFSSGELLDCYRAERAVLRRLTPDVPVTTNFMAAQFKPVDCRAWVASGELDLVSNDHYLRGEEPDSYLDLALAADLSRSLAGGGPWLLMEHSTSAVNWQPRNLAKRPGQLRRDSLQHVARGADGVMFFQWRASRGGAEKFHSGMVPHAGTDTKIWREVAQLGAELRRLTELKGSRVAAETAIVWDWEAWWAVELDAHPSSALAYLDQVRAHHAALWRLGVTADLVHPAADLSGYRAVLVPSLYLVSDEAAANLRRYAEGGGQLLVQCFSGIVDEHDQVLLGGYPGAFRDLLGIRVEEFFPLREGQTVRLDNGAEGSLWSELLHLDPGAGATMEGVGAADLKAEVLASYADGPVAAGPAITRRGTAWYLSTCLAPGDLERLLGQVCDAAGVRAASQTPNGRAPSGVEVVRRVTVEASRNNSYLFIINHNDRPATVPLATGGVELLSNAEVAGSIVVAPGDVAILREAGA